MWMVCSLPRALTVFMMTIPATNPNAKKIDCIRAEDIVKNNLKVIDMAAANLCFERKIPVIIFGLNEENSIMRAVGGEKIGTIVTV